MSDTQEKEINLREIWQIIARRKWLLIIPFLLILGISYGGSYLISPSYESSVILLTSRSSIVSGDLARMIPGEYDNIRMSDRQLARMSKEIQGRVASAVNLAKVIAQLKLDENPEMKSRAAELKNKFPDIPEQELIYRKLISRLRDGLQVSLIGENMIRITVQDTDPIMARDIAQTLAEVYREEMLKHDLLKIRSKLEFSNNQARIYRKELEDKAAELADFKRAYQKSALDKGFTTQENLQDIESELDHIRLNVKSDVIDRLNYLEARLSSLGIAPADIRIPGEINVHRRLLLDGTTHLAELMEKYTWRDAKVTHQRHTVENKIDTIKIMIDSLAGIEYSGLAEETLGLLTQYMSAKIELDYLVHKETCLIRSKENIKNSFTTGPDIDVRLAKLENEVEWARMLYDRFYESYTGSQLAMQIYREDAENRYRILEPAYVPLAPFRPNRFKTTVMGCALGILFGIGALILSEVTDNSIKKIENIEDSLNVKILGTIPKIEFLSASKRKVPAHKGTIWSKT